MSVECYHRRPPVVHVYEYPDDLDSWDPSDLLNRFPEWTVARQHGWNHGWTVTDQGGRSVRVNPACRYLVYSFSGGDERFEQYSAEEFESRFVHAGLPQPAP